MAFNGAQAHMLVNHLPVMGSLFSLLVLAGGFLLKNVSVRRTGMALLMFSALSALPAQLSGEPAEEVVEHLPGVSESFIHDHEEAAELGFVLMAVAGLVSVAGLAAGRMRKEAVESKVQVAALVISFVAAGALSRAAHLGGLIRHTELRGDAVASAISGEQGLPERKHDEED
jgi:hypothetical protein